MIVAGPRGRGISKVVFGRCVSRLAERGRVPVLFLTSSTQPAEEAEAIGEER